MYFKDALVVIPEYPVHARSEPFHHLNVEEDSHDFPVTRTANTEEEAFYETYKDKQKLSPLVREISWTNNLLIMTACKTDEAKEFYLRACMENHYSKRELERQIDSMLYERTAISDAKYGALVKKSEGLSGLRDAYVLEFLDLPASYKEKDFRKQIVSHLKDFILEFGGGGTSPSSGKSTDSRSATPISLSISSSSIAHSHALSPSSSRLACSSLSIWDS